MVDFLRVARSFSPGLCSISIEFVSVAYLLLVLPRWFRYFGFALAQWIFFLFGPSIFVLSPTPSLFRSVFRPTSSCWPVFSGSPWFTHGFLGLLRTLGPQFPEGSPS